MSIHVPPEAVVDRRKRRLLDWRLLAALTALLFMVLLFVGAWQSWEQRAAEAAQRDRLISQLGERADQIESLQGQVDTLTDRIVVLQDRAREDRQRAGEERRDASRERARLLRQQQRLHALLRRSGVRYVAPSASYTPSGALGPTARRDGGSSATTRTRTEVESEPTAGKSGRTPSGKANGLKRRR